MLSVDTASGKASTLSALLLRMSLWLSGVYMQAGDFFWGCMPCRKGSSVDESQVNYNNCCDGFVGCSDPLCCICVDDVNDCGDAFLLSLLFIALTILFIIASWMLALYVAFSCAVLCYLSSHFLHALAGILDQDVRRYGWISAGRLVLMGCLSYEILVHLTFPLARILVVHSGMHIGGYSVSLGAQQSMASALAVSLAAALVDGLIVMGITSLVRFLALKNRQSTAEGDPTAAVLAHPDCVATEWYNKPQLKIWIENGIALAAGALVGYEVYAHLSSVVRAVIWLPSPFISAFTAAVVVVFTVNALFVALFNRFEDRARIISTVHFIDRDIYYPRALFATEVVNDYEEPVLIGEEHSFRELIPGQH